MLRARWTLLAASSLLAACNTASPAQNAEPAAAAGSTVEASPNAAAPAAAKPAQQFAVPAGSTILSCTPIEDKRLPLPDGQISQVQPFQVLVDPTGRPLQFVGALPVRIPFQMERIDQVAGPAQLRVGAIIRYASRDATSEMHASVAIMKDNAYRVGVEYKTPTKSTNGTVIVGHGTCVSKPA